MIGHSQRLVAAAVAAALVPSARLLAQSERLEEILVTAQRREQSLQDVPISVTAITGEAIEQGGEAAHDVVEGLADCQARRWDRVLSPRQRGEY